jgi:hypothetical protein
VKRLLIGLGLLLSASMVGPAAVVGAQAVPSPSPTPTLRPIVLPTQPATKVSVSTGTAPRAGGFPIEVALPLLAGGGAAALGGSALLLRRRQRP